MVEKWKLLRVFERSNCATRSVVSQCGRFIVGYGKGAPDLWSIFDENVSFQLSHEELHCRSYFAGFFSDGNRAISYCENQFRIWNTADGAILSTIDTPYNINAIKLSLDGRLIGVQCYEALIVYDAATGKVRWHHELNESLRFARFSPDLTKVLYTTSNQPVLWDFQIATALDKPANFNPETFGSDSDKVAISRKNQILILDTRTNQTLQTLSRDSDVIQFRASPDFKYVWSYAKNPHYWHVDAERLLLTLKTDWTLAVPDFSLDGKRFAVGWARTFGVLDVRDTQSGELIGEIKTAGSEEGSPHFFPDSVHLACANTDYDVGLWGLE